MSESEPIPRLLFNASNLRAYVTMLVFIVFLCVVGSTVTEVQMHRLAKDKDSRERFIQSLQNWIGQGGWIPFCVSSCMMITIGLLIVVFASYLPLWLSEFRTWGTWRRRQIALFLASWNRAIGSKNSLLKLAEHLTVGK